jgi:pimeloyl-ACP methyl ester carboxylesterase
MTMTTSSTPRRFGELVGDFDPSTGDDGAPVVFLPGLTFDRTMWRPVLRSLREIDPARTTLALDMPGEGESVGTFRGLEAAIGQLHGAINSAGIENPLLVGHSGSAIAAMFYATKHPVRGIVNVDAVLDNGAFSARLRALEPQLRNGGIPAIWDELFAGMRAERCGPAGEAMLRATSRPRPDVMLGYWAPVLAPPPAAENAIAAAIAALRAQATPYTLVFGEEPDPATRLWMAEHFPEATVIVLPDSGHFPHVAHPDEFARVLTTADASSPPPPSVRVGPPEIGVASTEEHSHG